MGTTLHALLEAQDPAVPERDVPAQWTDVARWDFGKAYTLMIALREAINDGWPAEPSEEALELREECVADTGLMWAEPEHLPQQLELQGFAAEAYRALIAAMNEFDRPVRVLFWTL